jgi:ubiquinone/menaquinone biosynthesis C-methylase UbiE
MDTNEHEEMVRRSFRHQVDEFSGPDSPYARREGPTGWLDPLHSEMLGLEVACGAAHAAETVAPFVRQIVGIDLTRELLDVGATRLAEAGITNVLLQKGNAEALPFVDRSFDLVFCRSSLHHFGDPRGAVAEMVRVCRPGGRVAINDLIAPSQAVRDRFDQLHRLLDPSHVRTFLQEELLEVFRVGATLTYRDTTTMQFPVEIAMSDLSDRRAVLDALGHELAGHEATGFDPVEEDNSFVVSFTICSVQATVS